jgi:predicted RNA polymerase sigma factor
MTQDEIIEMARQAGFPIFGTKVVANDPMQQMLADAVTQHYHDSAIQFAKLVEERTAAKEREACAKAVENLRDKSGVNEDGNAWLTRLTRGDCVNAIRARAQADGGEA